MIRIKEFIRRVGIADQAELANRLGVTSNTISMWANGKRSPTYETCLTLLGMGMTVEELFGKPYPSSADALNQKSSLWEMMESNLQNMIKDIRRYKP